MCAKKDTTFLIFRQSLFSFLYLNYWGKNFKISVLLSFGKHITTRMLRVKSWTLMNCSILNINDIKSLQLQSLTDDRWKSIIVIPGGERRLKTKELRINHNDTSCTVARHCFEFCVQWGKWFACCNIKCMYWETMKDLRMTKRLIFSSISDTMPVLNMILT